MGQTMVQKIFARSAGLSAAPIGETVNIVPDLITMYDWPGISDYCLNMAEEYADLDTSKVIMYIDHKMPPCTIKDNAFHNQTIQYCKEHNIPCIIGQGIGHQLTLESGKVNPGDVVIHYDRHVNSLGAVGAFSVGTRLELIMALGTGKVAIQAPETIRIQLEGTMPDGVLGRDVFNRFLMDLGPAYASDKVVEIGGPGAASISIDSRFTICNMALFLNGITIMFEPDAVTRNFYEENFNRSIEPVLPDPDCHYSEVIHYDLSDFEPMTVVPPSPKSAVPLKEAEGIEIQQGNITSCAAGRLEDFEIAARILKGRKVHPGFRLYVTPSSKKVLLDATRLGYVETLMDAGAIITTSTCDFCYGNAGVLADGETALFTGTLNIPGRMGNVNSSIYIGSSATVAASAITGKITDPRKYL